MEHFSCAYVTFEPGARSAWHIHPAGQRLIVITGVGRTQVWGEAVKEVKPGDVIWCPPGVKHWHGASSTVGMKHLAITGSFNGKNVEWLDKVTNEQYAGAIAATSIKPDENMSANLSQKQIYLIPIAAFTANGNREKLLTSLNEGLDNGLTINEIKEVLVQLYAYAGFPRSLNALGAFMEVIKIREAQGRKDPMGKAANLIGENSLRIGEEIQTRLVGKPVSGPVYEFAPAIDRFLKSHLFGDIFGRDNLDFQSREVATISALASLEGVEPQLMAHFALGMNTGLTKEQLKELVAVLAAKVGPQEHYNTATTLDRLLNKDH